MIQVILGMGCDRNTPLSTLAIAVDQALTRLDLTAESVVAMATIDKKNDEVALLELAESEQWPIHFFSAEELANVTVPNPSEVVLKYMGTPAVAEAAAMLAAKCGVENLLLEKHKYRGEDGKNATVSIVRLPNE